MSNPTPEDVRKSIVPKSNQLNADDLLTGPIIVTVTKVSRGDKDQPINVHIDGGHQIYKPCKSMRRCLIAIWSDDSSKWVGQTMTLYCDPSVLYAGVRVGGIRISHLSGIDKTKTLLLTKSRGKRAEFVIQPIKTSLEDQASAPSSPGVTQERLDWLKVGWAKKYADTFGPDDDKKLLFGQWVKQTLGPDFNPDGKLDVDNREDWSTENIEQCEEAVK